MNTIFILIVVCDLWSSNIFIRNSSIALQEFKSKESCEYIKDILIKKGGKLNYIECVEVKE